MTNSSANAQISELHERAERERQIDADDVASEEEEVQPAPELALALLDDRGNRAGLGRPIEYSTILQRPQRNDGRLRGRY
jgi:hypothetical protein